MLKEFFNRNKSTIALTLLFGAVVVFVSASRVFAQSSFGLELPAQTGLGTLDLKLLIVRIVRIILGFLGIIAVLINLYAGYLWMVSQGDEEQIARAKKILINGIIGLIIIASSYLIVSYVISRFNEATQATINQDQAQNNYSVNGFALGAGSLNSVYPEPGISGLPRNTLIMANFKETLDVNSIIEPADIEACRGLVSGYCGYLKQFSAGGETRPAVRIINRSENNSVLAANEVVVSTADAKTFVFDPVAYLGSSGQNSDYSINITDQVKKENGSPAFLPGGYVWSFGVSGELDFIPPRIVLVSPSGNNPVPQNTVLRIEFSEAINPVTATGRSTGNPNEPFNHILAYYADNQEEAVYLRGNAVISNRFRTVEFIPEAVCQMPQERQVNSCGEVPRCFPENKIINITVKPAQVNQNGETTDVSSGITDAAGNSLDGNANGRPEGPDSDFYGSSFSTSGELDLTPPEITGVSPAQGDVTAPVNSPIRADFNENLLSSSVNADSFRIFDYACSGGDFPVQEDCYPSGGFSASAVGNITNLSVYRPFLDPLKRYNPRITSGIKDQNQNCFNPAQGVCVQGQDSPACN